MSVEKHALLCWQLGEGLVGGILIGTHLTMVRADKKKLTAAFSEELRRSEASLPDPLIGVRLKRVPVPFRPTYRAEGSDYPMPEAVDVMVDVVHGEHPSGGRMCFMPRLQRRFYFDEPDQLDTLVRHFAREQLREMSPEELYRSLLIAPPWLELLPVRAKKAPPRRWRKAPPSTPRLAQIAEKLPGKRRPGRGPASAWERTAEVEAVKALLLQPRGNILLVGEPGVGKSTILGEAIRDLSRRKGAPPFWRTAAQRLTAGAKYLGDWQQLCEQLAGELARVNGILWVEDFIALMTTGGSGPEDSVAAFWSPLLDRGELRLMCEISPRALDAARGMLPGFVARFQQLHIGEMRSAQVRAVIRRYAEQSERDLNIAFTPRARRLANRLLRRHVRYERFPGKAARLLADCTHRAQADGATEVDEPDVMERFIARTGMPRELLDDRIPLQPAAVRDWFDARIIGQPDAVSEVGRVIKTFKAGLNDPDRPLATLLFAGPTGVGKTAMAKALAGYFFGASADEAPLIRLDMSELQFAGQIDRLIGTTGGEPGELIRRLRQAPFSVVLFDEIEKANPLFFDLLLTVLDEGVLVDALGRETDFRGSVIIMTTNLGTGRGGSLGFSRASGRHDPSAVRQFFRPEFYNRIDRVVRFDALTSDAARKIARLELSAVEQREGLRVRRLKLDYSDAVVEHIVDLGFDPDYGARALQRVVEQRVVGPVGRFLLSAPALTDARLTVDLIDGEIAVFAP